MLDGSPLPRQMIGIAPCRVAWRRIGYEGVPRIWPRASWILQEPWVTLFDFLHVEVLHKESWKRITTGFYIIGYEIGLLLSPAENGA